MATKRYSFLIQGLVNHWETAAMDANLFWFNDEQWAKIVPHLPSNQPGPKRKDDRRILSGIMHVLKVGCRWRDCPKEYGPHKTLYNRFIRWSRLGVFDRIFAALASEEPKPERIMIDATQTAASLLKKGLFPAASGAPKAA
jgi:transposase